METILFNAFKNIPDRPIPNGLHETTMRQLVFVRTRRAVLALSLVAGLGFIFSVYYVYLRALETDLVGGLGSAISTLEPSFSSLSDALTFISDFVPKYAVFISLINLVVFSFTLYLTYLFKRIQRSVFTMTA